MRSTKRIFLLLLIALGVSGQGFQGGTTDFALERPSNLPTISQLEVMCGKDHMTVQLAFTLPFQGMVFSKGQYGISNCMYVTQRSGGQNFEFQIYYEQCGTKPDMGGRFYENTIIVQYDSDLIEVWDEAKRLRCEWYNDYEKTASKPPMVIADLEVVELNFRGDNVDCWMEIQDGKGPWASAVTGIVPLGSTLTMVVAINDYDDEFDMRVKSCEASDGINSPIFLSDENGCVLRPKMISKFMKLRNNDGRATVLTYAHFHAFKFPDSMAVHLRCKVEICRFGCPDHCQKPTAGNPIGNYNEPSQQLDVFPAGSQNRPKYKLPPQTQYGIEEKLESLRKPVSNDRIRSRPDPNNRRPNVSRQEDINNQPPNTFGKRNMNDQPLVIPDRKAALAYLTHQSEGDDEIEFPNDEDFPFGPRSLKRKRRYAVHDSHIQSTDIGVTIDYQVISEADLEFTPTRDEAVTVFKGHREHIVYGVCLPAPGFSALFVLLAMCTVISVLVAGFMCHHRQLQKDTTESAPHMHPSFNMVHFLRAQLSGHIL